MKLAFILFLVVSSVSATSVFAGRNRLVTNVLAAAGGANNGTGANANNSTAAAANNGTATAANNGTAAAANNGNTGDPQTSPTLDPTVISKNFEQNGQNPPVTGQTASLTSSNNFINFCLLTLKQFPLTDGQQLKGGSCNDVIVGLLPPANKMVSTIITFPQDGDVVEANKAFTITVLSINIKLGVFTNAQTTYLAAPQTLDPNTNEIVGHTHVTVQAITSTTAPPDPSQFAFFKGINSPADGQGQVSADVTNGLPPGDYRVCTMTSAANHQPVVMPIAQRGSQDDCVRFKAQVGAASNGTANAGGNNAANNAAGGNNAANNAAGGNNAANNTAANNTAGGNNAANNTAANNTAGGNAAANNTTANNTAGGNAANNTTTNTAGGNKATNNAAGNAAANNAANNAAGGGQQANRGGGGRRRKGKRWLNRDFV